MDGWNEDKVYDVINTCDDIYNLTYELKNCIKGCYTGCHNYEELQEYVRKLGQELIDAADYMDTTEDEDDEEFED